MNTTLIGAKPKLTPPIADWHILISDLSRDASYIKYWELNKLYGYPSQHWISRRLLTMLRLDQPKEQRAKQVLVCRPTRHSTLSSSILHPYLEEVYPSISLDLRGFYCLSWLLVPPGIIFVVGSKMLIIGDNAQDGSMMMKPWRNTTAESMTPSTKRKMETVPVVVVVAAPFPSEE